MIAQQKIRIEEYNYPLPAEKIAYFPAGSRDQSQLLVHKDGTITDATFKDLAQFLGPNDVLAFNNSRVIHARLLVQNRNGAAIEIFCLEPLAPTREIQEAFVQTCRVSWKCFVGNAKRWKEPIEFTVEVNQKPITITAVKGENSDGAFEVTFLWEDETVTLAEWIEAYGKIPLPPYIKRAAQTDDEQRYQTIFAQHNGSVAAPTAGLHFAQEVFRSLEEKNIETLWVTLHVGAGTFKPVSTETIGEHIMHKEQIVITRETIEAILNCNNKKIIAVGTTVARTLESLFIIGAKLNLNLPDPFNIQQWEIYENEELQKIDANTSLKAIYNYIVTNNLPFLTASTALMITPGYEHKIARGLITNFHQPQSTLLLLIASYLGEKWKEIYQHALTHNYRFLSYGDSNLYL